MMNEALDLKSKDLVKVLRSYSIGDYISHEKLWWSLDNLVYKVKTTQGTYLLKLFKDSDVGHTKWTLQIMEKVRRKGVPVPKVFKTKTRSLLSSYLGKQLFIQEYVQGNELKHADKKFVGEFARNLGLLDKNLLTMPLSGTYLWGNIGHQFERSTYRDGAVIEDFSHASAEEKTLEELNKIVNKRKLRPSVIHADYTLTNLIVKDNRIQAIIDWDDMHEDFLAFEVAIAINHLFFIDKKADSEQLSHFFKEYQRYVKLNEEEKKAIFYFVKIRMLSNMVWCSLQRKKHPDKQEKLTQWLKGVIKSYQEFDSISLKSFLESVQ